MKKQPISISHVYFDKQGYSKKDVYAWLKRHKYEKDGLVKETNTGKWEAKVHYPYEKRKKKTYRYGKMNRGVQFKFVIPL